MIEIDKFLKYHHAFSSERTLEYYHSCLFMFNNFLKSKNIYNVSDITSDIFLEYIIFLKSKNIKNTSVNTYTRAVRVWCSWLIEHNYICSSFCNVKKLRDDSLNIIPLTNHDVFILDNILNSYPDLRNYLIFHLMLDCGLRRQEVINLDVPDIHSNFLNIKNSKYNKSRIVPLPDFLYKKILVYKNNRTSGPLFLLKSGGRITINSVKKIFYVLKNKTNISVHPHLLRHSFATSYIYYGGNLEILRIILGHSSYTCTQNYLHLAAEFLISHIDLYKLDICFFNFPERK